MLILFKLDKVRDLWWARGGDL